MPREKLTGVCTQCHKEKPIFDTKNMVCGSCAGKNGGGRPKSIRVVKNPGETLTKEPILKNSPGTDQAPASPPPGPAPAPGQEKYLCDACGKEVRYGQRKCSCGSWIDWRGSPVESDPDLVICPECGAVCGHAGQVAVCPNCNFGA